MLTLYQLPEGPSETLAVANKQQLQYTWWTMYTRFSTWPDKLYLTVVADWSIAPQDYIIYMWWSISPDDLPDSKFCWVNIGQCLLNTCIVSPTLAQHWPNIGPLRHAIWVDCLMLSTIFWVLIKGHWPEWRHNPLEHRKSSTSVKLVNR